jgi:uncharacterized protein involved in exopolysaccharide biosynthesis
VKYNETIFDILSRQFEVAKLDEAKQGARVQVVDAAIPPDRRSFPKRGMIVILATAVGFFVGIFLALVKAAFQRIEDIPQAAQKLYYLRKLLSFRRTSNR